jgi:hypothetical protein
LISDSEMSCLFGEEVSSALAELEEFNSQGQICSRCRGQCCMLVSCELYAPAFTCCPVQGFRPVLCRMHFCRRFTEAYPLLVKQTGDIYLDSLIAAEKRGFKGVALFDCPPLNKVAPGMVQTLSRSIVAFREGRIDEATALKAIKAAVEDYHTEKKAEGQVT